MLGDWKRTVLCVSGGGGFFYCFCFFGEVFGEGFFVDDDAAGDLVMRLAASTQGDVA